MAKHQNTTGLINAPKPKPPKPKSSPKGFLWTHPDIATDEDKKKFAASLQELLPPVEWTHTNLAEALWGRDNFSARNIGKAREWVRGEGRFPNEKEAAYIAQLLKVTMQRLMQPTAPFDPNAGGMVRPAREAKGGVAKSDPVKTKPGPRPKNFGKHANGHDPDDRRWIRPEGLNAVNLKMETHETHSGYMTLNITGAVPTNIAKAVMIILESKGANE